MFVWEDGGEVLRKRYLGIDFGNEGVRVALVSSFLRRRKLEGLGFAPYIQVEGMKDGDTKVEALRKALEMAGPNGFKGAKVVVSIPLSDVFMKEIKLPKTSRSQQRRMLELGEIGRHVPMDVNEILFSFYPVGDMRGKDVSVLLVAARKDVVDKYVGCVRAVGLNPDIVTSKAMGIIEWHGRIKGGPQAPVAIVEPDGDLMDMVVVRGRSVVLKRTIPLGDEDVLRDELGISFGYLEREGLSPKAIYILGPHGGPLEGILPQISDALLLSPIGWPFVKDGKDEEGLRWVGTIGLALLGEKPSSKVANLVERVKEGKRTRTIAIFLVGLYLLANIWGYVEMNGRIEGKRRRLSALNREYKALEPTFIALSGSNSQMGSSQIGTTRYGAVWLRILLELSKLAPRGVWLTDISMEKEKGISVRGRALDEPSLTSFLEALGSSKIIRDVELKFAGQGLAEGKQVVDFQITFVAEGMERKAVGTIQRGSMEEMLR